MHVGSNRAAWVMADCTSTAAPSRFRLRSNSSVICVEPREFVEVIESNPAMLENWFSSGVATADAMVSGLAPGRLAVTSSVVGGRDRAARDALGVRDRGAQLPRAVGERDRLP